MKRIIAQQNGIKKSLNKLIIVLSKVKTLQKMKGIMENN